MTATAVTLCATLAGCSDIYYDRRESIALSAGDAVATDKVTQMVDPWPAESSNRNIAFNGEKMQTAVERYRTNKVIPPASAMTSSSGYQQAQPAAQPTTSGKP
jgi:hypothetical protein